MKNTTKVIAGSLGDEKVSISSFSQIEELTGKLGMDASGKKLLHSVLENDQKKIDEGRIIADSINHGVSFNADMIFEKLVKDYNDADRLYGERMIRILSSYSSKYLQKNIALPEFQKVLKNKISEKIEELKEEKLISKDGTLTEKGIAIASLIMYVDEITKISAQGLGRRDSLKKSTYGSKEEMRPYTIGTRYRDVSIQKSLKKAIRRGHERVIKEDLEAFERRSTSSLNVIYALDASGSMKGKKLAECKKAAIALAFKAIDEKDKVGLLAFGTQVKARVLPTNNFAEILKAVVMVSASEQTGIARIIREAIHLFPSIGTNHLILITDAVPTAGTHPEQETLDAVSLARNSNITVSIIGISPDEQGKVLAGKIAKMGQGRFLIVKKIEELDRIVLEDYYAQKNS